MALPLPPVVLMRPLRVARRMPKRAMRRLRLRLLSMARPRSRLWRTARRATSEVRFQFVDVCAASMRVVAFVYCAPDGGLRCLFCFQVLWRRRLCTPTRLRLRHRCSVEPSTQPPLPPRRPKASTLLPTMALLRAAACLVGRFSSHVCVLRGCVVSDDRHKAAEEKKRKQSTLQV
jgi:hypothetical protein